MSIKIVNICKEIGKHIKLYMLFLKFSFMSIVEYRANFIIGLIVENFYLFTKIMYLVIIHNTGISINGFTPDYMTLYVGTFTIITALYNGIFVDNFYSIPRNIKTGSLDLLITKPISLQFILTLKQFNFSMLISNLIGGIIMVSIAWQRLSISVNFSNILIYSFLLLCGITIAYCIFLIPMLLSFWVVEVRALISIADRGWDFNTMPMVIYNRFIRSLCVFVLPIFAITNFAPLFLVNKLDFVYLVWAVIAPVTLLIIVRLFWSFAIRNYTSANG